MSPKPGKFQLTLDQKRGAFQQDRELYDFLDKAKGAGKPEPRTTFEKIVEALRGAMKFNPEE